MTTIEQHMMTTAFELPGYKITKNLGMAKGIIVRSRSIFGTIGGGLQTLVGGNITLFTSLAEKSRNHAYGLLREHAGEMGANAVIGVRFDATEMGSGITEVLAYGTAVVAEKTA
jgi:uncharacterized protein YbjQ (UPF0145 family)